MSFFSSSSKGDEVSLTDARAGASEQGAAGSAVGKGAKSEIKTGGEGGLLIDYSGIGAINAGKRSDVNIGTAGSGSTGGSGANMGVNISTVIHDPAAALRAIEENKNVAIAGYNTVSAALDRAYASSDKQQDFVERTVADAVNSVKELALPANERGFNNTLFVVGALIGLYLFNKL